MHLLWSSNQNGKRDNVGRFAKYVLELTTPYGETAAQKVVIKK